MEENSEQNNSPKTVSSRAMKIVLLVAVMGVAVIVTFFGIHVGGKFSQEQEHQRKPPNSKVCITQVGYGSDCK